jgi:hypothetical protein
MIYRRTDANETQKMKEKKFNNKKKAQDTEEEENTLPEFSIDVKRNIIDIINDSPSLVKLGDKEYRVKDMRYYSVFRICRLVTDMRKADETLDDDNKVITALCTDLDAMCEIMAIVLCNHQFIPDRENADEKNDEMIRQMKIKVMNSTFDANQWAAIILGAIQSIDLSAFFLLKKSVSTLTDSLLMRKRKSMETASQFMEALSLRTQQTSSKPSRSTG